VAPLLSPLFDFTPSTSSLGALPVTAPVGTASPRPLSASSSYSSIGAGANYMAAIPSSLAPPPIMPGSALRLLNQGRAQGLFTPSTSGLSLLAQGRPSGFNSPGPYQQSGYSQSPHPQTSETPPPVNLKRHRSEADVDSLGPAAGQMHYILPLASFIYFNFFYIDFLQGDRTRPPSANSQANGDDNPSPAKRPRKESLTQEPSSSQPMTWQSSRAQTHHNAPSNHQQAFNGALRAPTAVSATNGSAGHPITISPDLDIHKARFASKSLLPPSGQTSYNYKDKRKAAVVASICQRDEPAPVLDFLRELSSDPVNLDPPAPLDIDAVLDDQGHTALHMAASLGRLQIVDELISNGADIHRGNYLGESPLIRACLATHNADQQTFSSLVVVLHLSIRTLDTSRKSVLHHIVSLAGVKGRAVAARYYLDQIFLWIAQQQGGDFRSLVDLQDEHGDTALNIAARVGNRSLVRTLLDVGANRTLPNKLGLRPGDFGVETEVKQPFSFSLQPLGQFLLGVEWWSSSRGYPLELTCRTASTCPEESRRDCWFVY